MDLLILEEVRSEQSPVYCGTDRTIPYYCEGYGDQHPVNQAFFWFCTEWGEYGAVHDLARAHELVKAYRAISPPRYFEILEVTKSNPPQNTNSRFLGFDLSAGFSYSLLGWGLEIDREPSVRLPEGDLFWILHPLLRLIKEFFKPKLNPNGLFADYDPAHFCLECMLALQKIRPGLWENDEIEFEIVGLWKVLFEQ